MNTLAPRSYFDEVIRAMRLRGLVKFTEVTINQEDVQYHVPATMARSTNMFFHLPQRAAIVHLEYSESDSRDQYEGMEKVGIVGSWGMAIYTEFMPYGRILDHLIKKGVEFEEWSREADKIPLYRQCPKYISALKYRGMSRYGDPYEQAGMIDPRTLADGIGEVMDSIADLLNGGRFKELQVTEFPPHYAYPRCEEIFWGRFDRAWLHRLIERPWGSPGLKR